MKLWLLIPIVTAWMLAFPLEVPVTPVDKQAQVFRLQRDMLSLQSSMTDTVEHFNKLKSEFDGRKRELQQVLKSLDIPGWKLDPETLVYTEDRKSDSNE